MIKRKKPSVKSEKLMTSVNILRTNIGCFLHSNQWQDFRNSSYTKLGICIHCMTVLHKKLSKFRIRRMSSFVYESFRKSCPRSFYLNYPKTSDPEIYGQRTVKWCPLHVPTLNLINPRLTKNLTFKAQRKCQI